MSRKTVTLPILADTRDLLSGLCYLRSSDLVVGRSVVCDVVADGRLWHLAATVQRQGTILLDQGAFPVVEVEIQGSWFDRVLNRQTLWIWLTTDPTHTPLMVRLRIPFVGTLTAILDDRQPAWPPHDPPAS